MHNKTATATARAKSEKELERNSILSESFSSFYSERSPPLARLPAFNLEMRIPRRAVERAVEIIDVN